jgi:hypothetical protein
MAIGASQLACGQAAVDVRRERIGVEMLRPFHRRKRTLVEIRGRMRNILCST